MRKIFVFIILILLSQIGLAQTKVDEYRDLNSDRESGRLDSFVISLMQEPESRGLIVVYTGTNREKLGNILGQINGIKYYLSLWDKRRNTTNLNKISFVITEGRERFLKEMWIAKKDEKLSEFKQINFDFSDINKKYLYAQTAFDYEPTVPIIDSGLVDARGFAEIVNQNKMFRGLIYIEKQYLKYAVDSRNKLIKDFALNAGKVSIKISTNRYANFFIVPQITKNKRK